MSFWKSYSEYVLQLYNLCRYQSTKVLITIHFLDSGAGEIWWKVSMKRMANYLGSASQPVAAAWRFVRISKNLFVN